jgi:hypothetical protein
LLAAATMGSVLAACSTVMVPTDLKLIVGARRRRRHFQQLWSVSRRRLHVKIERSPESASSKYQTWWSSRHERDETRSRAAHHVPRLRVPTHRNARWTQGSSGTFFRRTGIVGS